MNNMESLPVIVVTADQESRVITRLEVELMDGGTIGLGSLKNNWYRNPTLTTKVLWYFLEHPNLKIRSGDIAETFKIDPLLASSMVQSLVKKLPGLLLKQGDRRVNEYSLVVKEIRWKDPSGYF